MSQQANAANYPSTVDSTPREKTMSEAAIAANALQHGLCSLRNFEDFVHDNDLKLEVVTNIMEQFEPITPAEHLLTHLEMRFLQMEFLYNRAMAGPLEDILAKPCPLLAQILRELNALPRRPNSPNKRTKISKSNPSQTSNRSRTFTNRNPNQQQQKTRMILT